MLENTKKKEKKELDLQTEKISKIFWLFAIPSILAIVMQSTAGLIDSIFIGRFVGASGLSAITLVMPIIMLFEGISIMIAIGGTTLAGINKGKGDEKKSNNFFNVTLTLTMVLAVASMFIVLGLGNSFASLLGATGEVAKNLGDYVTTIAMFFIPFMMNFAMGFFLKLDGKPIAPVIAVSLGMVINIVLDYVFIVYMKLGIEGAAFATGLSQLVPFLILFYMLAKRTNWKFAKPVFIMSEVKQMLFNGSSELLSMASVSISSFIYNMIIISNVGIEGIASYTVAVQVGNLSVGIFYGFAESVQSPVSVNYGRKQLDRVAEFRKMSSKANLVSGLVICTAVFAFGRNIASVFLTDQSIIDMAIYILRFFGVSYIFAGMNITLATYYTAVNSPILSGGLTVVRSLVSLIIGLLVLPMIFGEVGIWSAIIFAEITSFIVARICYKKWPYGSIEKGKVFNADASNVQRAS